MFCLAQIDVLIQQTLITVRTTTDGRHSTANRHGAVPSRRHIPTPSGTFTFQARRKTLNSINACSLTVSRVYYFVVGSVGTVPP